jgi:sec-independent protein translocase protein TatB
VFDFSLTKLAILLVIAIVVFGPDQLPKVAGQAARTLRDLRRLADNARQDLQEGLGPEFGEFDLNDLNPRNFVRKHLLDDLEEGFQNPGPYDHVSPQPGQDDTALAVLPPGETPPYDAEAT